RSVARGGCVRWPLPDGRLRVDSSQTIMCIELTFDTHHAHEHRDRRQADERHASRDGSEDQARGRGTRTAYSPATASARRDTALARQVELERRPRRHENRQVILVDSSAWIDYFRGA